MASYTAQSREAGRAPLPVDTVRETGERWWVQPLLYVLGLTAFGVYTTWRAFENRYFIFSPGVLVPDASWHSPGILNEAVDRATYLSPFFSPYIPLSLAVGTFAISPAFYILIFPLAFRLTCYYYRKAYYRSFLFDPPACAVSEPNPDKRMSYTGERAFPWIVQNFHRYAFAAAAIFVVILAWDAIKAFIYVDTDGGHHFYLGIGSIIFVVNVVLLAAYTFGCHSCRHLVGGRVNCYSCSNLNKTRYGLWTKVSFLNKRHALFAWLSMGSVLLADLWVNLIARGTIPFDQIIGPR